MTQPMKLSILIGADAAGVKAGGSAAEAALGRVGAAANQAGTSIQRMIEASTGLSKAASDFDFKASAFAAQAAQLDDLRAKYNPVFAAITRYKTEVAGIRLANQLGAISTTEMTAAISRERQATLASIDAIKSRNAAIRSMPAANTNVRGFETANIAAQLQDVGITAAMGMSPLQIALQQGPQLSSVFAGMANPVRGLAAAFTSLISPTSLVTIGLVGLAAAAIQYFTSVDEKSSAASDALASHEEFVRRIKGAYGDALAGLREYAAESKKILDQEARDRIALYQGTLDAANDAATKAFTSLSVDEFGGATKIINDINLAIGQLQKTGDLKAYIEALIDIENHPGTPEAIREIAKSIRESSKEGLEAQAKLAPLKQIIDGVGVTASQQVGRINALSDALEKLRATALPALTDLEKLRREFEAALDGPAGATEAGVRELEKAYKDAQKRILDQSPTVPNTSGVDVKVPIPAEKPNLLDYDPDEDANRKLEQARKDAAEKLEQQRKAYQDYIQTQNDGIARLQLEISLVGKSAEERAKATAAFEAEQKIRELGLQTMSREADLIRLRAQETANLRLVLERQQAAYQAAQQAGSTMIDQLTVGAGSLKDRFKAMADTLLTTFQQLAIANPLKNQLLGTNLPTIGDLFTGNKAAFSPATTTGAMTVTAGTVMINGVPLGVPGANTTLGGFLGAANTNTPAAANLNIANGVRPDAIAGAIVNNPVNTDPASRALLYRQAISQIESGSYAGNYNAIGPMTRTGDQAYGRYQVMGNNIGPWTEQHYGQRLTPQQFLANPAAQDAVFDKEFGGYVNRYGEGGAATKWFTGSPVARGRTDITGTTDHRYAAQFEQNMQKLGQSANTASNQVDTFGTGALDATKALNSGANSITGSVNTLATQTAQVPAQSQGLFSGLFSSIGKGLSGFASGIGSIFSSIFGGLFADGAAFSGGSVIPFATGGVVTKPTMFPMAGGRVGVMGEAGEEAIMPLRRGADGRLGVTMALPRQVRQSGGEMRLNMSSSNTIVIQGNGDNELHERWRMGTEQMLEQRDRQWRAAFPTMIEEYRKNPYAKYHG